MLWAVRYTSCSIEAKTHNSPFFDWSDLSCLFNLMPNRLAGSTSPYLLQHQNNPVDWYPWSAEALDKAKKEDKPIFLSIGYSACHTGVM